MTRNVLGELDIITSEIVDVGYRRLPTGMNKSYDYFTQEVYSKLMSYVRGGSWTENDTARFVAQNFHIGQSNLSEVWSQMFPTKPPKAESTIRTQYQKVNRYLQNVLPVNLVDIFITEDEDGLASLSELVDALILNDQRVESKLGEQLISSLQEIPLGARRYTAEDCENEIKTIKKLSLAQCSDLLKTCDSAKLAYTYHILTRPSVVKGELNKSRLEFIKAFVNTKVDYEQKPVIGGYACANPIEVIRQYSEGGTVNKDGVINPNVVDCIRSIITQKGILEQLSHFTKDEVAYALNMLETGDKDFYMAFEEGRDRSSENKIGGITFLDGVTDCIDACTELADGDAQYISANTLMTLLDYTPKVMNKRLSALDKSELDLLCRKLEAEDKQVLTALNSLSGEDIDAFVQERLSAKKKYIDEH